MADNFLMKGKVFKERKHLLTYPVVVEAKHDEIRVHVSFIPGPDIVQFLSYAGKPLHNLSAFASQFANLMRAYGIRNLDCGFECNGNFSDSHRWTASKNGIPQEKFDKATGKTHPALDLDMCKWFLFDCPDWDNSSYGHRRVELGLLADWSSHHEGTPLLDRPYNRIAEDEAGVMLAFEEMRRAGLEGSMVKTFEHKYVSGCAHRSDGWLKLKPSDTKDGKIIAINRAVSIHGEPLDRAGSVTVECEDGSLASPAGIPHAIGADMYAHPERYVHEWCEFTFMEQLATGGYRHPFFNRLRDSKD